MAWGIAATMTAIAGFAVFGLANVLTQRTCRGYNTTRARVDLRELNTALHLFKVEHGRFPNPQEGVNALVNPPPLPSRASGRYLFELRLDPWGRAYVYHAPPANAPGPPRFRILSAGPDGQEGTADDLTDGN